MTSFTRHTVKKSLYHMPTEIIAAVFIEWTMWKWSAAAIARQICRHFKIITDSTPRVWSKLFLSRRSRATADDVRAWLKHAKAAPKEIRLETENISIISATLESVKDATSLFYRIPLLEDVPPPQEELIRLTIRLPRLRHLHLGSTRLHNFTSTNRIFELYNSPIDAHFPCLTALSIAVTDLSNLHIMPGLFPVMRLLVLDCVRGSILDLIQACSGSLEELRVMNSPDDQQPPPHDHICLPNLKVLVVELAVGIVSNIEAPTLRLIYADLDEMDGSTRSFPSVVEWATCQYPSRFQQTDLTLHLKNMPRLHHLVLSRDPGTLDGIFVSLRDVPTLCPDLQSIEVVEFMEASGPYPEFKLDKEVKEGMHESVGERAGRVPGFTLQFVDFEDQLRRLARYTDSYVCSFNFMRRYLSYHASRNTIPPSKDSKEQ